MRVVSPRQCCIRSNRSRTRNRERGGRYVRRNSVSVTTCAAVGCSRSQSARSRERHVICVDRDAQPSANGECAARSQVAATGESCARRELACTSCNALSRSAYKSPRLKLGSSLDAMIKSPSSVPFTILPLVKILVL